MNFNKVMQNAGKVMMQLGFKLILLVCVLVVFRPLPVGADWRPVITSVTATEEGAGPLVTVSWTSVDIPGGQDELSWMFVRPEYIFQCPG